MNMFLVSISMCAPFSGLKVLIIDSLFRLWRDIILSDPFYRGEYISQIRALTHVRDGDLLVALREISPIFRRINASPRIRSSAFRLCRFTLVRLLLSLRTPLDDFSRPPPNTQRRI